MAAFRNQPSYHARRLPLGGVRALDLANVMVGPYCSMVVGELGADVIKSGRRPAPSGVVRRRLAHEALDAVSPHGLNLCTMPQSP